MRKHLPRFLQFALVIAVVALFAAPSLVGAACPSGPTCEPPRLGDVVLQFYRIIDLFYAFGGIGFLMLAIVIGIQWMTSQGSSDKLEELRKRFFYWLIGFVLFFLSATIVTFIYQALEVKDCSGNQMLPGFNLFADQACQ
jgi:cytochrome bd-type quinol oxidase subunit 2